MYVFPEMTLASTEKVACAVISSPKFEVAVNVTVPPKSTEETSETISIALKTGPFDVPADSSLPQEVKQKKL